MYIPPRSSRTAQTDNSPLGWAEVVHPFHPFRGQRFEVLKTRRVSGVETLIVRHPERGTCTLAREWTDWSEPSPYRVLGVSEPSFDFDSLLQLALFVNQLDEREGVDE